ncbi:hypothetical protein [Diaphorobacter sp.]|uniref:hypothetical protein n=1 Tax=Diaphorobacter sp. TaxID=1934310 RepID=UPI002583BFE8|nr:hypothetical protein [Diaphorobacter sp.]
MTEVTINRHAVADNFSVLRNDVVRDDRLSWKATGILCWLLGLPQDWRVRLSHLAQQKTDGRDSTRAGLAELEAVGYLWIERRRDGGRFERVVWHVTDTPEAANFPQKNANKPAISADLPRSGNTKTANPKTANATLRRTKDTKDLGDEELIQTPPPPRAHAHAHAQGEQQTGSLPAAGGGHDENFVYQAACKAKLSPATGRRVARLAEGAAAEQVAWLALLLEQLPALAAERKVEAPEGYALSLAERAAAGELTRPASAAPAPAPVEVYKPEPRGLTTPEGLAAGKASIAALQAKIHGGRHHGPGATTPRVGRGAQ